MNKRERLKLEEAKAAKQKRNREIGFELARWVLRMDWTQVWENLKEFAADFPI